jgi:hypothetical protein
MKMWTYQVEEDIRGGFVDKIDHEGDEDEENPHSGGLDEDPQDGLRVSRVSTVLDGHAKAHTWRADEVAWRTSRCVFQMKKVIRAEKKLESRASGDHPTRRTKAVDVLGNRHTKGGNRPFPYRP